MSLTIWSIYKSDVCWSNSFALVSVIYLDLVSYTYKNSNSQLTLKFIETGGDLFETAEVLAVEEQTFKFLDTTDLFQIAVQGINIGPVVEGPGSSLWRNLCPGVSSFSTSQDDQFLTFRKRRWKSVEDLSSMGLSLGGLKPLSLRNNMK